MIFCMTSSTCYHLFVALNQKLADHLLRIDLIGISIMIFVCTLTSVRAAFYADPTARDAIMITMMGLFIGNAIISATPCYNQPECNKCRTGFFIAVLFICLGIAASWMLYFATDYEVKVFSKDLILSFVWLGIGFGFYASGFPEKYWPNWKFGHVWL